MTAQHKECEIIADIKHAALISGPKAGIAVTAL